MITLENIKEHCKSWFEDNNVECPRRAKDWRHVGESIPPGTSATVLRRLGLKPADIINYIYGEGSASSNRRHVLNYEELGLTFIAKHPVGNGHTNIEYGCLTCGNVDITDQGTIVRWKERDVRGCPTCRNSTGKKKSLEHYQALVGPSFKLTEVEGNRRRYKVHCLDCSFDFSRSTAQITSRETEDIFCPSCGDSSLYVKGGEGKYDSMIEKDLTEHLLSLMADVDTQVRYDTFLTTDRKFVADVFIPRYDLVIEITSKSNNLPKYFDRIEEKRLLCEGGGIKFFLAYSKSDIEDIVRSLSKDKEL